MRVKSQANCIVILWFILFLGHDLLSQTKNFQFKNVSTLQGLSNNSVIDILEDSKGFIWFATRDGLNRFDGYDFVTFKYDLTNRNTIPNNFILCLAEDQANNLWIGTNQSGLARYNLITEQFYRYAHNPNDDNTIPGTVIRKIKVDNYNTVWVATDNGFAKYDSVNNFFHRIAFPYGNGSTYTFDLKDLFLKGEDYIIAQCNLGLFEINVLTGVVKKVLNKVPSRINNLLRENAPILFDKSNNLWIGGRRGLVKYNMHTQNVKEYISNPKYLSTISSTNIASIFQDSEGNIWFGTQDNGLNLYDKNSDNFIRYKSSEITQTEMASGIINCIYEDKHANIWLATDNGGVSYFNCKNNYFNYFRHKPQNINSLSDNVVQAFYEDKNDNLWIGTGDGKINKSNEGNFKVVQLSKKDLSVSVHDIISNDKDRDRLYVSGWGLGLYEYDIKTGKSKNLMLNKSINGLPISKDIKGMGKDAAGNIWLATHVEEGIVVYSPTKNMFFNKNYPGEFNKQLLSVPYAVDFYNDSKNRLWVVSYTGLYLYDSIFQKFSSSALEVNTISSDYLYTLFEDNDKNIWVGSLNGLDKIIEKPNGVIEFERMNYKYDLPNNIKGILQDDNGCLWLSSNNEITQFNTESKKIRHFKINKELPNNEFIERACYRTTNGNMLFGSNNGFFKFNPDSISQQVAHGKVYFTDFMLFNEKQSVSSISGVINKSILETKDIQLKYDQSVFSIKYAGINFNPYETLEYAYKMEGFDKDWYYVADKRSVTFTNLKHGNYLFRVKLVKGEDFIESSEATLKITIKPPYWRTKIAYGIYIILTLVVLYLFRRSIINKEKLKSQLKLEKLALKNVHENNLMKLRFFTNISHEFRTPLTLIKAPIEKLLYTPEQLSVEDNNYHLTLIHKNTNRLLRLVNQLMDYRKLEAGSLVLEPSYGDLIHFCKTIFNNFVVLANQNKIDYRFKSNVKTHNCLFDSDKLDKVFNNLLSNAFKYTPKNGSISMKVSKLNTGVDNNQYIKVEVGDSGVGINEKETAFIFDRFYTVTKSKENNIEGTGIGLTLAKELTELHKGTISVASVEGKGSKFTVNLPLNESLSSLDKIEFSDDREYEGKINNGELLIDEIIDGQNSKPKILLVEDDKDLRVFLSKELESLFQVVQAKNGNEALVVANKEKFDLVLSDVMMPKMDGFELCKRLKSNDRTSHLPVVLLTARHSQQKQIEGFDIGADDYLLKPFNTKILTSRILNILNIRTEIIEKFKNGSSFYFNDDGITDKDKKFIQGIIDIVLKNITHENINADYIAKKMLVSRSLVYLKIEAIVGLSVNNFIRNIRLKKSLQLLQEGNLTVTEIAYTVGFSSQSYFTRSFKKEYGKSPKEYMEII